MSFPSFSILIRLCRAQLVQANQNPRGHGSGFREPTSHSIPHILPTAPRKSRFIEAILQVVWLMTRLIAGMISRTPFTEALLDPRWTL